MKLYSRLSYFVRGLNILLLIGFLIMQSSCASKGVSLPTDTPTQEVISVTNTIPPTSTPLPSPTPQPSATFAPTPAIVGNWSDAPSMLLPRSGHAVASTGLAIYALAGTDDQGRPLLEVEKFDGKTWTKETMLPGEGLNAPTAPTINHK